MWVPEKINHWPQTRNGWRRNEILTTAIQAETYLLKGCGMNPNSDQPHIAISNRDWGLLLFLGAIWGASFFFGRIAVAEIPPFSLVFLRVAIAALTLIAWLAMRGQELSRIIKFSAPFALLSILNNIIPFSLIFTGQIEIGAGLASVLNATTPFWTIVLATFLTSNERATKLKLIGVMLGIIGTAIMVGPDLAQGLGAPWWAKLAVVGAAISYGFAGIFAKRFSDLKPTTIAASQLVWSTILIAPMAFVVDGSALFRVSDLAIWSSVIALAVLCTAFAYILFFTLISSAGASNTSLVTLIVPVSALLLGTLFLGEVLTLYEITGMVLIGIGLLVIDGRLFARR